MRRTSVNPRRIDDVAINHTSKFPLHWSSHDSVIAETAPLERPSDNPQSCRQNAWDFNAANQRQCCAPPLPNRT
eukprot:1904528-Pyramimonas_sp.AAC.1